MHIGEVIEEFERQRDRDDTDSTIMHEVLKIYETN